MRGAAIIGATIGEEFLPDPQEWELWSVNNLYRQFPNTQFDRWFELHKFIRRWINGYNRRGVNVYGGVTVGEYMRQIDGLNCPVYMQRHWRAIKQSIRFPFEDIISKYGEYFGCSFAWLTAFAIEEGFEKIGYFGVGLTGKEYYYQKPSTEYFIGLARGKGIGVYIDPTSTLLKEPFIYAYREDHELINSLFCEPNDFWMTMFVTMINHYKTMFWYGDHDSI